MAPGTFGVTRIKMRRDQVVQNRRVVHILSRLEYRKGTIEVVCGELIVAVDGRRETADTLYVSKYVEIGRRIVLLDDDERIFRLFDIVVLNIGLGEHEAGHVGVMLVADLA